MTAAQTLMALLTGASAFTVSAKHSGPRRSPSHRKTGPGRYPASRSEQQRRSVAAARRTCAECGYLTVTGPKTVHGPRWARGYSHVRVTIRDGVITVRDNSSGRLVIRGAA